MSESALKKEEETPSLCRPFLKWAGGKRQLLGEILQRAPAEYGTYHEPFIGGGAVFFGLRPQRAILADLNEELISCYESVRDELPALLDWLEQYKYEEKEYYRIRSLDRTPEFQILPKYVRAARLIYLNKTCFNGLYRVNRSGFFNTPFGRYANPKIVDYENLKACSDVLQEVEFHVGPFETLLDRVAEGDFVYLDPPYPPVSASADFTSYTDKDFSWEDQVRLKGVCDQLHERGVKFLLSNAGIASVRELYRDYSLDEVDAKRAINSKGGKRGEVPEFLIRNYSSLKGEQL